MRQRLPRPSQDQLLEILSYDPLTGLLTWKERYRENGRPLGRAGSIAGTKVYGYIQVGINSISLRAHIIIWVMVYGQYPRGEIDHINLDRSDNRLSNLRLASHSQNGANKEVYNKKHLPKGVSIEIDCGVTRYRARITKNYQNYWLGLFATPEEAAAAYKAKAEELFGDFHRA